MMCSRFVLCLLVTLCTVSTGLVPGHDEVSVAVGKPRMIFRGGQSPVLVKLANGWIIADFADRKGKVYAGRSRSAVVSKDLGKTWQPWPESTRTSHDGSRVVLADGTAIALSQRSQPIPGREHRFTGLRWYSTDHWQTVGGPEPTETQLPDFAVGEADDGTTTGPQFFGRALARPDGSILTAMHTNFTPDRKYQPTPGKRLPWRTILVRSSDLGKTWDYISTVACQDWISDPLVRENWQQGFGEPALEIFPDGKMICVMRTGASAGSKTTEAYYDLAMTAIRNPNLRFIRPEKGGFLSVHVDNRNGQVVAELKLHEVDGTAYWEDRLTS